MRKSDLGTVEDAEMPDTAKFDALVDVLSRLQAMGQLDVAI